MAKRKKYQVFISSTYKDLIDERNAVTQCLLDNDCIPVGMEQFPASNMTQMDYIKKMLDDCDYYILILAGKYGSVDNDGVGYTEKEYNYAISKGIPVLSFVIKDLEKLSLSQCETDQRQRKKLENFRKKVCAGKLVRFYSNADELKGHVSASIYKAIRDFPAIGWVRGTSNTNTAGDRVVVENSHISNSYNVKLANEQILYNEDKKNARLTEQSFIDFISSINVRQWNQAFNSFDSYKTEEHVGGVFSVYNSLIENEYGDNETCLATLRFYKTLYNIASDLRRIDVCDFLLSITADSLIPYARTMFRSDKDKEHFLSDRFNDFWRSSLVQLFYEKMKVAKTEEEDHLWLVCADELLTLYQLVLSMEDK